MEVYSTVDSFVENSSKKSENDMYTDRNSSTGSKLSELAIHTSLVETRYLDREMFQDPVPEFRTVVSIMRVYCSGYEGVLWVWKR